MHIIRPSIGERRSFDYPPGIVTIGNFDGVHRGHQALIATMKQLQAQHDGALSTLITFDRHPALYFNATAFDGVITGLREKSYWLHHFGVDRLALMPFNQRFAKMSAQDFVEKILIEQIQTRCLVIGKDFVFGQGRKGNFELLRQYADKGAFSLVPIDDIRDEDTQRVSSTRIRGAIKSGDVSKAIQLSGHPLALLGRVIRGKQLGRTIGFPTANIRVHNPHLIYNGVYAVSVYSNSGWQSRGIANIGTRPTVHANGAKFVEVHLFDYHQDCYDECLRVEVEDFVRNEEKFDDITALTRQIEKDVMQVKRYFAAQLTPLTGLT